jgi:hypothetical protein
MLDKLFEPSFANVPVFGIKLDEIEASLAEICHRQVVDFKDKASHLVFRMPGEWQHCMPVTDAPERPRLRYFCDRQYTHLHLISGRLPHTRPVQP